MFFIQFGRNVFDSEDDEERDDNEVVYLPENWNEIGNEVEWEQGITNGCPQQPPCVFGCAWVVIEALKDLEVLLEILTCLNELLFDHHCVI